MNERVSVTATQSINQSVIIKSFTRNTLDCDRPI